MALYPSAVVSFTEVYNKSMCRPREILVEIHQEYPDDIEHIFIPSCVVLMRCAGCCNDEMLDCTPTATRNITMEVRKPLTENVTENLTANGECLSALFCQHVSFSLSTWFLMWITCIFLHVISSVYNIWFVRANW